jgi:hypothetical protein
MELTRRWFVFGSVAAVAAATIPVAVSNLIVEPMPSAHVFLKRRIVDLSFAFDPLLPGTPDEMAIIEIFVDRNGEARGLSQFHIAINTRSNFRWVASHDETSGFFIRPEDVFRLEVNANHRVGQLYLIAKDWIDDGPPIEVCEYHTFPQQGPLQPMFLHADNSLEARLARKAEIEAASAEYDRKVAAGEIIEEDFIEEDFDDEVLLKKILMTRCNRHDNQTKSR